MKRDDIISPNSEKSITHNLNSLKTMMNTTGNIDSAEQRFGKKHPSWSERVAVEAATAKCRYHCIAIVVTTTTTTTITTKNFTFMNRISQPVFQPF